MATLPQALAAVPTIFSACKPKDDVLQGTMADAEFAADLAQVLRGNAPAQYADPARFFSNTYPTVAAGHEIWNCPGVPGVIWGDGIGARLNPTVAVPELSGDTFTVNRCAAES